MDYIETQSAAWTSIREEFEPWSQTANGPGSTIGATEAVRDRLPYILNEYEIATVLDAPCGDMNWMSLVDLAEVEYLGWDVEPTMVSRNETRFPMLSFERVNLLLPHKVPQVDLIICRDFLIHVTMEDVISILNRFKDSGSQYLLTTTLPGAGSNFDELPEEGHDMRPGYWYRAVDMDAPPFSVILGQALDGFDETDGHRMQLYRLNEPA